MHSWSADASDQKTQIKMAIPNYISKLLIVISILIEIASCGEHSKTSRTLIKRHQEKEYKQTNTIATLLDTTEQSSLGWTHYPDGGPGGQGRTPGWSEETFLQVERDINWRSFVTCDVAYNSVNNWLWTPYLERGDANRLYIEIKFTMRDCNLFPQMVLSCKETFALLYKEVDGPIQTQAKAAPGSASGPGQSAANVLFAQSDNYTLIDAIAADDGRFTSNSDVVINTEIRSVPVSKRGVYFAFRDQGACLSLISIKVYSLKCPQVVASLARFNATPTGKDLTSLVAVDGECVPNAVQVEQPRMFCTADGQWNSMSSDQCKCQAGYEPVANMTKCQACPPGRYKPLAGDSPCLPCPDKSASGGSGSPAGATECKCQDNYFRAAKDSRSAPCTQPPGGPPVNLSAVYVDSTSVVLQWQPPRLTGGRDDLTYKLLCDACDLAQLVSSPQYLTNFSETKCVLSGLAPATSYRFTLYAMNGVTLAAMKHFQVTQQQQPQQQFSSEITVTTSRPLQQTTGNTLSSQNGGFQLLPIYNFRALPGARGTDMLLAWDTSSQVQQQQQQSSSASTSDLLLDPALLGSGAPSEPPSLYEIRFQPRQVQPSAQQQQQQQSGVDMMARRSPYPLLFEPQQQQPHNQLQVAQVGPNSHLQQSITTTNRAIGIYTLLPRTDYAFQIRAKWSSGPLAHQQASGQWSDWSEPIYALTGSAGSSLGQQHHHHSPSLLAPFLTPTGGGVGSLDALAQIDQFPIQFDPTHNAPFTSLNSQQQQQQQQQQPFQSMSSSASWLGSFLIILVCSLIVSIVLVATLIHYRNSLCLRSLSSLSGGLVGSNIGSTYAGVYNGGTSSDLIGASAGLGGPGTGLYGPAGGGLIYHNGLGGLTLAAANGNGHQHHAHQHHHLHSSSAGALITGSNSTSRSSSGAGNVVQNFIAATLGQFAGHNNSAANQHYTQNGNNLAKTLTSAGQQHEPSGKLFLNSASGATQNDHHQHHLQQQQQQHHLNGTGTEYPRNHYHQMLGSVNHTLLLSGQHGQYQPSGMPIVPTSAGHQIHLGQQQQPQQANGQLAHQLAGGGGGLGNCSPPQVSVADFFGSTTIGGQQHHQPHQQQHKQQSKYGNSRTLSGQQQYGLTSVHDPHIYDDIEVVSQSRQSLNCSPVGAKFVVVSAANNQAQPTIVAQQQQQQQQQNQHQRRDSLQQQQKLAMRQQHQIYSRDVYDANKSNGSAATGGGGGSLVIGQANGATTTIVQPLAASRTGAKQQQTQHQQFYKEEQRGDDEFYDE